MQFYDRPRNRRIALGGSSNRPATSEELLVRARKAREERAHRRAQQQAATDIQAAWRRRKAIFDLVAELECKQNASTNPRKALVSMLFVAGLLNTSGKSVSDNVLLVDQRAATRPFLHTFVSHLSTALSASSTANPIFENVSDPLSSSMLVKTIALLLSLAANAFQDSPVSKSTANPQANIYQENTLSTALILLTQLNVSSLLNQAKWGLHIHAANALRSLSKSPHNDSHRRTLVDIINTSVSFTGQPEAPRSIAIILRRQFAYSLLSIDHLLDFYPLANNPKLVADIACAMSSHTNACTDYDFIWDMSNSYASLSSSSTAVVLSNFLELGNEFWAGDGSDALWPFVAVLSNLVRSLPLNDPASVADDSDEDMEGGSLAHEGKVLSSLMTRLRQSLKRIVSERTVRSLFNAAVAEGRGAISRVCQLFSFLLSHDKSLTTALQNALAFSRGGGDQGRDHILKLLWQYCRHSSDGSASHLSEETTPILSIFAMAYSYLLYVQDPDELFERNWPFSVEEVREIVHFMKNLLFSALFVRPIRNLPGASDMQNALLLRKEPGLIDHISGLLSRLYLCDSKRPFRVGDDFWHAGSSLSSDAFLEDAIEAGPEALTRTSDAMETRTENRPATKNRQTSVTGAGDLLRTAPYLVPFSTRARIFQCWISKERDIANGGQSIFPSIGRSVAVRRKFLFEDAYKELNGMGPGLKATVRVKFIDEHGIEEVGIDGGGVFKEFMHEVLKLGFSPFSYGLFKDSPDRHLYPSPDAPVGNENFENQFTFLGRLLGKAVFDGVLVNIPLARFFLLKMLGQFNYPIDLGSLDPQLYKNMKFLKNYPPGSVEDLGLNFTVASNAFGAVKEIELIKNGRNIPITAENRIEYIHRVANYRMNTQIKRQSDAFIRGFADVVPLRFIRLFSHEELQLLISGRVGELDLQDWKRHTAYSGGYVEETPVIRWFWEALSELTAEQQGKLLQFVTSSPRAPLMGFSYLVPSFCIHRSEGHVRLPTASTCMNLLKLPEYKSLEVVREKLLYAIESNTGFHLS